METIMTASAAQITALLPRALPSTPELVHAANDVLLQGLTLLFEIGDNTYSRTAQAPFHASIGGHYRHVLEHFQSLVRGLRASEVNYDARERNVRLQTEVTYASVGTCDILRALKHYDDGILTRECKVINSVGYGGTMPVEMASNVGRELAYCVGHAIHHYAIIRLICHEFGIALPATFGVAPSTLKHQAATASQA